MVSKKAKSSAAPKMNVAAESNPWLPVTEENAEGGAAAQKPAARHQARKKHNNNNRGFVDVDRAVDLLESNPPNAASATNDNNNDSKTASAADDPALEKKKITTLTQEELVRKAFATAQSEQDIDDEFAQEKAVVEEREDPLLRKQKKEKDLKTSAGWGSWAGAGAPPPRPTKFPKKLQPPESKNNKRKRVDAKRPNLILSEKRIKKTADKFMLSEIPYPFTSREEYERSMAGGVGREWNVTSGFKDMTRPEIITRAGKVIQPISKKVKQKRAPAKF